MHDHQDHLHRAFERLPDRIRPAALRLLRPEAKWVRMPLGAALVLCGLFGFLPILGFWMIPLGLLLLAEDIPVIRTPTARAIDAAARCWKSCSLCLRRIAGRRKASQPDL